MGRQNRVGVFEAAQNLTLAELFRVALRSQRLSIRTHTVCTVRTYNPTTQTVDVAVDILAVVTDTLTRPTSQDPNPTSVQRPVLLSEIPVAWPRTSSGYLTFPLSEGDKGELHVHDRGLDAWLDQGDAVDPIDMATHALGAATFQPTIYNTANPITPATDTDAVVLEGEHIKIGRGASDAAARVGDSTNPVGVIGDPTSMLGWMSLVTTNINLLAPGAIPGLPINFGKIATGSSKVDIE